MVGDRAIYLYLGRFALLSQTKPRLMLEPATILGGSIALTNTARSLYANQTRCNT